MINNEKQIVYSQFQAQLNMLSTLILGRVVNKSCC